MHACQGSTEVQAESALPVMIDASSMWSVRPGRGSMAAETTTARNNAPTAITNANIVHSFQPMLAAGVDGEMAAEPH